MKKLFYSIILIFCCFFIGNNIAQAGCTISSSGNYAYMNGVQYKLMCISAGGSSNTGEATCDEITGRKEKVIDWIFRKYESFNDRQFMERLLTQSRVLSDSNLIGTSGGMIVRMLYNYGKAGTVEGYLDRQGWGEFLTTKQGGTYKTLEDAANAYLEEHPASSYQAAYDMVVLQNKQPDRDKVVKMVEAAIEYTAVAGRAGYMSSTIEEDKTVYNDYSLGEYKTEISYNYLSGGGLVCSLEDCPPPPGGQTKTNVPTCNNGGLSKVGEEMTKTGGTITFAYTGDGQLTGATAECENCTASAAVAGNTIVVTVAISGAVEGESGATQSDDVCILGLGKKQCEYNVSVSANVTLTTVEDNSGNVTAVEPDDTSKYDNAPDYIDVYTEGTLAQNYIGYKIKSSSSSNPGAKVETCEVVGAAAGMFDCGSAENGEIDCEGAMTPSVSNVTNNCCEEGINEIKEDDLNKLFCASPKLGVKYYKRLEGADYYLDGVAAGKLSDVSEYCKVYCTERATIQQPGAMTATSGTTFQLNSINTEVGITTTSAYVKSFKRCREIINYHKWVTDYREVVKKQVDSFDQYQVAKTAEYVYNGMYEKKEEVVPTATANCKDTNPHWETVTVNGMNVGRKWVDNSYSQSFPKSAGTITYFHYDKPKKNHLKFYVGIINPDQHVHRNLKTYTSINVEYDDKGHYEMEDCAEHFNPSLYACDSTSDNRSSVAGEMKYDHDEVTLTPEDKEKINAKADESDSLANAFNCGGGFSKSVSPAQKETRCAEHPDEVLEGIQGDVESQAGIYSDSTSEAKELEEKLKKCQTFFESTSAEEMYKVNTDMKFSYVQTYLNENMGCITDQQYVNYNPGFGSKNCKISGPSIGADAENGTEDKTYSSEYGGGKERMHDLLTGEPGWGLEAKSLKWDADYQADKMFSIDAVYRADCLKIEEESQLTNEYPSGNVLTPDHGSQVTSTFNKTIHSKEYNIQVTALTGTYETFWEITGLGEGGKFDPYIGNGETCSGLKAEASTVNSALAAGSCGDNYYRSKVHLEDNVYTCKLTIVEELVQVGKCNDIAPYKGCKIDVEGYNFFNFKLVDESNLFPVCSMPTNPSNDQMNGCYTSKKYGYNWLELESGQNALREIQKTGASNATYSPSHLTYSINLTPETINSIREYNDRVGSYDDFNLTCEGSGTTVGCTRVPGENTCVSPTGLTKCKSKFMEAFYGSGLLPETGGKVEKSSGSIDSIRNKIWK